MGPAAAELLLAKPWDAAAELLLAKPKAGGANPRLMSTFCGAPKRLKGRRNGGAEAALVFAGLTRVALRELLRLERALGLA